MVFPRNQYHPGYIAAAKELGFLNFRTNPLDWFWENTAEETLLKKIFRTGDTLIPLGKRTSFLPSLSKNGEIPASRLLRPYREGSVFNKIRIDRIKSELKSACHRNEAYHLWWHPHNFGNNPEACMQELKKIVGKFAWLRENRGMESLSMEELGTRITKNIPSPIIR